MKKITAALALALAALLLGLPGTASAHFNTIGGSTQCRASATANWIVSWTVSPGADYGGTWMITSPSPSGYSPAGSQPSTLSFTKTVSYPAGQPSATESVTNTWSDGNSASSNDTVNRPQVCGEATTTTTAHPTTTNPNNTTTTTTTTTTTEPVDNTTTTSTTTEPEDTTTTTADVPPSTDEAPPVTDDVPPSTDEAPPSTDEAPPVTDDVPPSTDEAPPVTDDVPPSTDEAPPVTDGVPPSTDEAPPVTDGTPGTDNAPPPTDVSGEGPPDTSGGTTGGETPTLPATGNNGLNNMLTAALVLFGFGALTVSAARGQRSELLDS